MNAMREWLRRVWFLLNRRRMERELAREMEAHREMAGGQGAPFGNALRLREESADVWGWNWLDSAWQDLRFAARTLKPGFACTAGLVLSIGIGVNLGLFQMMSVALLQPPAVKDPATLVKFRRQSENMVSTGVPYAATQVVRRNNRTLRAVLARARTELTWGSDGVERVKAAFVSANWFQEMGYGAARGRVFSEAIEEKAGAPPVAVLSDAMWRTRFDSDPAVVGRTVRLNNRVVVVAGVVPLQFPALAMEIVDVWLPIEHHGYFHPGGEFGTTWSANNTEMFGRVKAGIPLGGVREDMRTVMAEVARIRPVEFEKGEWLEPHSSMQLFRAPNEIRRVRTAWMLIGTLTMLVLLVACSNVGNLLLSRAAGRVREMSVRLAMGASRWRLMRQLLMESLLVAMIGAAGGLLLASWGSEIIARQVELPPNFQFAPDLRMLGAAMAAALFTAAVVGLAPAWRVSRHDLSGAMKDGGQQNAGGLERTRLRKVLLAAQVAASCLLLVLAGLMVEGARRLLHEDHGFSYEKVAVLRPGLDRYGIKGADAREWWARVRESIIAMGETERAALVSHQPLGGGEFTTGYNDTPGIHTTVLAVDREFFGVMGIRLLGGRTFLPSDGHKTTIIISRRLAQAMYGTVDVVGKGFPKAEPRRTIAGVTADAPLIKIQANNVAEQYEPLDPEKYSEYLMVVKARTDAKALLGPLRGAAKTADSRVLAKAVTLAGEMDKRMESTRLASLLFAVNGLVALGLACFGIYAVVSFGVAMRTKEIGIRTALGSPGQAILGLLLREQAWPLALGIAIGLAGARVLSGNMRGEPAYLGPMGLAIPAMVVALFGLTAGLAILAPARRATRMDPLRALRHE